MSASRSGSALSVEDATLTYGVGESAVMALDRISLEIPPREFVSILGPSGCGKTSLLMVISGLFPPSGGTIRVDDQVVTGPVTKLGIVFQNSALLNWRTSLGNVMLQAQAHGMDKETARAKSSEMLDLVGLSDFQHRRPYELSGGMRQRVAVSRALVHNPPLLLMDEPFGALDELTRSQLRFDLQGLLETHPATVVFVTHSISEAVFLSDRVIVMTGRPGSIAADLRIESERPRMISMLKEAHLRDYINQIEDIFQDKGVLYGGNDDASVHPET